MLCPHSLAVAAMGHASRIPPVPPLLREYQSSSSTDNLDVQQPLSPRRVATPLSSGITDEDRTSTTQTQPETAVKIPSGPDTQPSPKRPTKFRNLLNFWTCKSSGNKTPRESNTMGPITSPPQTSASRPTIAGSSAITRNSSQVSGSTATPVKWLSLLNIPFFRCLSPPDIQNEPPPPVYPLRTRRTRFDSGAPLPPRRTPLRPDERRRANVLVGPASGHVHIRTRSFGSMSSEMLQNVLIGVEKIIRDFIALNSRTQAVASKWCMHVGKIKTLPTSSQPLPRDSPVGKGPSQFPSAEDYAYFSLLSIMNTHLYNRIFHPFHPAVSDAENAKLETTYQRQLETCVCLCLDTDGHNYAQLYFFVQFYKSEQLNGVRNVSSLSKPGSTTFRGRRCFATYPTPYSRPG